MKLFCLNFWEGISSGNSDGLAHPHLITMKSTWTLLNESLVFKELNKTFNQERF